MTNESVRLKECPYKVGDRVEMAKFGHGTVTKVVPPGGQVMFDKPGVTVNLAFMDFLSPSDVPAPANDNDPGKPWMKSLRFTPINPTIWHEKPVPDRQWYIPDLVPMRQVTLLYGDGGVGKSLLALQIAAAGALSVETLELEPWAGRVLYLGAEDEAEEFQRRLAAILKAHNKDFDDLLLFRLLAMADADALLSVPDRAGNMQPTPLWLDLAKYAADFKPKLIVLDTVADLFAGDEIKRGQARQFVGMLRKLAIEIDCAIILLAHPSVQGMTSGTGTSGSTGWSNSARSRLYLTRGDKDDDPDLRILKTMKSNYGTVGDELKLRWQDGAFVLDDGKPSVAAGLLSKHADAKFRELLSAINRSGQRVAPTKGVNYAPTIMAAWPDAGVSKKELEAAMHRLLASGIIKVVRDGPPSKQRQRLIVSAEDFGPQEEES
jgi:RecA-family ATPase